MRKIHWSGIIAGFFILVAIAVFLRSIDHETTLEFQIRDRVSKAWVWDFTARLQNRTICGFYQSDSGILPYKFTSLKPGDWELIISAPSYENKMVPLKLIKGKNILIEPVEMDGYEIPDLNRFYTFVEPQGKDIIVELRPTGTDGKAIVNHPCIDLWIGCRVSVQMKDGVFVREPTEEGSVYGKELFKGNIQWEWDPSPGTVFRYHATIPGSKIAEHQAPYRVIDYFIVVMDTRKITKKELEELIERNLDISEPDKLKMFLDSHDNELDYFIHRNWNVPKY